MRASLTRFKVRERERRKNEGKPALWPFITLVNRFGSPEPNRFLFGSSSPFLTFRSASPFNPMAPVHFITVCFHVFGACSFVVDRQIYLSDGSDGS